MQDTMMFSSIYQASNACIQRLRGLSQSHSSRSNGLPEVVAKGLQHELGRFFIWCGDLGALRQPKHRTPLDVRVAESSLTRDSILWNLQVLQECLERAETVVKTGHHRVGTSRQGTSVQQDQSVFQYDPQDKPQNEYETRTSELEEVLRQIRESVTQLFKIAMLLRQARPRGLESKVALGESTLDTKYDIGHVWEKFVKLRKHPWLYERLGHAITQRREHLRYREHHSRTLATAHDSESESLKSENGEKKQPSAPTTIATTFVERSNAADQGHEEFHDDPDACSVGSVTTHGTSESSITAGALRVPEPTAAIGDAFEYGETFECPYCRTMQTVENWTAWKRHVYNDLQPYTCTFQHYNLELNAFARRHEWLDHEMRLHRVKYRCALCDCASFSDHSGMEEHLHGLHAQEFTQAQLNSLIAICAETERHFPNGACPLVNDWKPPDGATDNVSQFYRHVGRHMEQLALAALPRSTDDEEAVTEPHAAM